MRPLGMFDIPWIFYYKKLSIYIQFETRHFEIFSKSPQINLLEFFYIVAENRCKQSKKRTFQPQISLLVAAKSTTKNIFSPFISHTKSLSHTRREIIKNSSDEKFFGTKTRQTIKKILHVDNNG